MPEGDYSYATLSQLPDLENLYQIYKKDANRIDSSWRYFFEGMEFAQARSRVAQPSIEGSKAGCVETLIDAYRRFGHLLGIYNPLGQGSVEEVTLLRPESWGFQPKENVMGPAGQILIESLIATLQGWYCTGLGVEYMHLESQQMRSWLQQQIEVTAQPFSSEEKRQICQMLCQTQVFENFLHTKYVGQKRFSLEGSETLIPVILALLEAEGVSESVMGMSHRGRLNVLAHVLGKPYAAIFSEFEDRPGTQPGAYSGDVKYHKGFKGKKVLPSGKQVEITLCANPSHLESVDPVAEGVARAKQEQKGSDKHLLPLLIHGDAAIAGQGVVYETLQLSRLAGYTTGGTVHVIVNNQIGFTTGAKEGRSTRYCSDIAKAFNAPVFHVNAENPLQCVQAARLAGKMRQEFGCDVFIDLNSYRKYGHNEGDEPTFTHPLEYQVIRSKVTIHALFVQQLMAEGTITQEESQRFEQESKGKMEQALLTQGSDPIPSQSDLSPQAPQTAVPLEQLQQLITSLVTIPSGLQLHPKIKKLLDERLLLRDAPASTPKVDWGWAEQLAMGSLLMDKVSLRLSGQDVGRGTFSHRHALWVDQKTGAPYFPLAHIQADQGRFEAFNSPLSEYAVLGFDFGYSLAKPKTLVIWEAQFGDFANTAQVLIDQYIASSEQKWDVHTNLVLLLPHGYEGQGPEHSSARMERFLQLCAQENMRVANCSTPSQLFHLLRDQGLRSIKKPLILFTPKALLRHPVCVSSLQELATGRFEALLAEGSEQSTSLILCSGKVYYDLLKEKEKRGAAQTAIVRIEQLYPFPAEAMQHLLKRYPFVKEVRWVQEEPSNMGPWEFVRPELNRLLGVKEGVEYVGRDRSASPAAGSHTLHQTQLTSLLEQAFKAKGLS